MSRLTFPPKFGLRQRMVLFFGLAAMAAAIALSVVTFASTRSYLLGQRSEVAQRQAFNNAQLMIRHKILGKAALLLWHNP